MASSKVKIGDEIVISHYDLLKPLSNCIIYVQFEGEPTPLKCRVMDIDSSSARVRVVSPGTKE